MQPIRQRRGMGIFLLILLMQLVAIAFVANQKINFHVDECLTYALANHIDGLELVPENGILTDTSVFTDFFSVTEGHRFDYAMVWKNQTNDVHPPLYYVLIHTISSMIPNVVFSKWVGISVNMLFAVLSSIVLFFLVKEIYPKTALPLLFCALYAVSPGFLNAAVFIRMYIMVTFWILCLALLYVRQGQKKGNWQFYAKVGAVTIAGVLTHYYYLIFLFFIAAYVGIRLLIQRRFKEAVCYAGMLGASGVVSVAVFPAMTDHIFNGYRGTASIAYLVQTINVRERFLEFYGYFNDQLFGGGFWIVLLLFVAVVAVVVSKESSKLSVKEILLHPWTPVMFSVIAYFLVVAKSAPVICDRYLFPIYPFLFLFAFSVMAHLFEVLLSKKAILFGLVVSFLVTSYVSYKKTGIPYLYQETEPMLSVAESYADQVCVVVYDTSHILLPSYEEFRKYKGLIFIPADQLTLLSECDLEQYGDIIVYVTKYLDANAVINQIEEENEYFTEKTVLLNEDYFYVFHLK